ncbi:hypothetical protein SRB5_13660 [Streptomyces sp. RB5]|uniref:Lipoprotein n=1 Tax=Streptomyces smaragdinus TaxID=2585196 RepID=A0A7K0CCS2_9ACTN|nr:hypothetical protein [Streptomyces smaragdinus]MQY11251.1 hypothetical protein [Streptomyces smaragdinus]
MRTPLRRIAVTVLLSCSLVAGVTACSSTEAKRPESSQRAAAAAAVPAQTTPSPSPTATRERLNRTRFAANAGLAAGATYQWIIKPFREGKFKRGADGRTFALIKAGLAGAFAYNRLKAAQKNAQGDPILEKALAPITGGVEALRSLGGKLRRGQVDESGIGGVEDLLNGFKSAGKEAGVDVVPKVPSTGQLSGG